MNIHLQSLWDLAEHLGEAKHRGLDEEALNDLPTSTYSSGLLISNSFYFLF